MQEIKRRNRNIMTSNEGAVYARGPFAIRKFAALEAAAVINLESCCLMVDPLGVK